MVMMKLLIIIFFFCCELYEVYDVDDCLITILYSPPKDLLFYTTQRERKKKVNVKVDEVYDDYDEHNKPS